MATPIKLFIAYAPEDEAWRKILENHLMPLERENIIQPWHLGKIIPGEEWEAKTQDQMELAQIILLLVSPDFMASESCYGQQMQWAIQYHNNGRARVIPVLLRPVDWESTPFGKMQVLPSNSQPVTAWSNPDAAFLEIVQGLKHVINTERFPFKDLRLDRKVIVCLEARLINHRNEIIEVRHQEKWIKPQSAYPYALMREVFISTNRMPSRGGKYEIELSVRGQSPFFVKKGGNIPITGDKGWDWWMRTIPIPTFECDVWCNLQVINDEVLSYEFHIGPPGSNAPKTEFRGYQQLHLENS
jgi:hypothetical protein